ncbi:MAG TPA: TldD/PmbA family protein [Thermodesulfovibrionales bacterium]|nr:TldD/PmbA family protein [Thermodesulfovibrionales bacterium]
MFETLRSIISKADAEYADLRYEVRKDTRIIFNGRELFSIGSNSTDGFVLRVLKQGGLSSVAFTKAADADQAMRIASENALLMARFAGKPVELAGTLAVKDEFLPGLDEDPRKVPMDEKLDLTRMYNSRALGHEKIVTSNIVYSETIREKYFLSSEGSEVREDLVTTVLGGMLTSKDGNLTQNVRVAAGGSTGFAVLRNREEDFDNKAVIAAELLKARPVESGVYNVVLNQDMAGVFVHEAFGHFSEADLIEDSPTMRERMQIGAKLGNIALNITDDPTMPGQLGFYRYDDEGVRARPVRLMQKGVLTGRLHSRRTASAFGEELTGHCVAEDYRFAPIVRMGNIFIEAGKDTLENLLAMLGDGLYILDAKGGQTSGENFTFGAQYGYIVKSGKIAEMVRDINISGNLYNTMQNISAVGNDLRLCETGGCGKGQLNIRSCHGGPHILVNGLIVGGV